MGVFQSNPKLLEDYLRSRESRRLSAPVQHQDFQGQLGFKGLLPLPWKDEVRPPNSFNEQQQQQMRSQQPVWFQQQQQLVGGKLKLLPASLVKQQEQLLPETLQQQQHVVGGAKLEDNQ